MNSRMAQFPKEHTTPSSPKWEQCESAESTGNGGCVLLSLPASQKKNLWGWGSPILSKTSQSCLCVYYECQSGIRRHRLSTRPSQTHWRLVGTAAWFSTSAKHCHSTD